MFVIKEIGEENLQDVVKFAWELSKNKAKNSFPKFESYEDMYDVFKKSVNDENDKVLAFYENGNLCGVLNLLIKPEDAYMQGNGGIYAKDNFSNVATQFIDYIKNNYTDYELFFGYSSDNDEGINYMEKIKAELVEASYTMELKNTYFIYTNQLKDNLVVKLIPDYYQEFLKFHDLYNPDMYWNSQRLLEKINLFDIFVIIKENKIVGSIVISSYEILGTKEAEIFAVTVDNKFQHGGLELALLSESLRNIFDKGVERVLYFIDKSAKDELEAAYQIGFKQIDDYNCYRIKV